MSNKFNKKYRNIGKSNFFHFENKPPFKQGLYSYKNSLGKNPINYLEMNESNKTLKNNYSNYIYSPIKGNTDITKDKFIPKFSSGGVSGVNDSIFSSSINLNKYKMPNIERKDLTKNIDRSYKKISEVKIIGENNHYNSNNSIDLKKVIHPTIRSQEKTTNTDINFSKDYNLPDLGNNEINQKKPLREHCFDKLLYERESKRMINEYIKMLRLSCSNINEILSQNKFINRNSFANESIINDDKLFGDAKKELYLKNLDYTQSSELLSLDSEDENSNNLQQVKVDNTYLNEIIIPNNSKIDIISFLCAPRILNLISKEESGIINKNKCIFILLPDKSCLEGKESYIFEWLNIKTHEVNKLNINQIKSCLLNKDNDNSNNTNNFKIEVIESSEEIKNYYYEIEAPSRDICNNYVEGINYILQILKMQT